MVFFFFSEWFQIQTEFKTPFEEMSPKELNKCLQMFYLSARKRDGSFYNKKTLTSFRAALDRHLQKSFWAVLSHCFSIY